MTPRVTISLEEVYCGGPEYTDCLDPAFRAATIASEDGGRIQSVFHCELFRCSKAGKGLGIRRATWQINRSWTS